MNSLMLLWQEFAAQCGDECSVSTARDVLTVARRIEHEGCSFLGITLPRFGKDFERSLDSGCVSRSAFQGFTWRGGLPAFLGGFLDLVFDRRSGRLLDRPSVAAIHSVRELCLFAGKVEVTASDRRRDIAIGGYVECEREVKRSDVSRSDSVYSEFGQVSHLLFGEILSRVEQQLFREKRGNERGRFNTDPDWPYVFPKHGPGATADRLGGNAKFDLTEWPRRLEDVFPFGEYGIPNWRFYDRHDRVDFLEPGNERAAKLVDVPKDLSKPRLIAKEPSAMQYMQQGVSILLKQVVKADPSVGAMIGFDDQEANHRLCRIGSLTGEFATLDLSEASDRVSYQLVRLMSKKWYHFAMAIDCTRSRHVDVPGFGEIALAKYASMGSALTFPVEAMVFLTAVFMGIQRGSDRLLTQEDVLSLEGKVRVYGDDIIVPVEYTHSVIGALEDLGLKVNTNKSFWTGKFRESCGKEYYEGVDVTVVRLRHVTVNPDSSWSLPTSRKDVLQTESLVSLRNRCYAGGWWRVAKWLDSWAASLLGGRYPTVLATHLGPEEELGARSDGLVRWSLVGHQVDYTTVNTQAPMVRCWKREHNTPDSLVSGEGALLKILSYRGLEPLRGKHLEHAGRPTSSTLKRRSVSPF